METDPDWFDLNDWILEFFPTVYEATKYLSDMSAQRKIWLLVWNGNPDKQTPGELALQQ